MNDREQRGLAIAALFRIDRQPDGTYLVPSQSGNGTRYVVDPDPARPSCNCADHKDRGVKCKHLFAVEFAQTREQNCDGTMTVTQTVTITDRVSYKQNWPAYNAAQSNEKRHFQEILCSLCKGIKEPVRDGNRGRPPLPLADRIFAVAFKVFSTLSGRRFACDLASAFEKGHLSHLPHFNSVLQYLEHAEITPLLRALVVESSLPLKAVETEFAVDSSGFCTSRFVRWFDVKYGRTIQEREWVKVHLATGIKTNVVTAVEILDKNAADSPQFGPLLTQTAKNFTVKEVSADSAYCSLVNMESVAAVGGTPYIAFKENTTGGVGGLFAKMFHYFNFNKDDFLKHYHKRSNVESTVSMMKAKFGDALRSRTDVAMVNEVLCKVLCHNICCLIQAMYELGIEPVFWGKDEAQSSMEVGPVACETLGLDCGAWMEWV